MWWLDPGKEVLNVVCLKLILSTNTSPQFLSNQLFNRILAPYVENLDFNQVNYGIGQGMSDRPFLQTSNLISHRSVDPSASAPEKGCTG